MDRRKKPLEVTASSVSAGMDDATGSEFFLPPRISWPGWFFNSGIQPRPPLKQEPDLVFLRRETGPLFLPTRGRAWLPLGCALGPGFPLDTHLPWCLLCQASPGLPRRHPVRASSPARLPAGLCLLSTHIPLPASPTRRPGRSPQHQGDLSPHRELSRC